MLSTNFRSTCNHCGHAIPSGVLVDECPNCGENPNSILVRAVYGFDQKNWDQVFQTSGSISAISPIFDNKVEIDPLKSRLGSLEQDLSKIKASQENILNTTNGLQEEIKKVLESVDAHAELKEQPEVQRFLEGLQSLDMLLNLDESNLSAPIFVQMLKKDLAEIDSRLSAKIDANTTITMAYERVLNQQRKVLDQQAGLYVWFKRAAIFTPIAIAFAPAIELLVKAMIGL